MQLRVDGFEWTDGDSSGYIGITSWFAVALALICLYLKQRSLIFGSLLLFPCSIDPFVWIVAKETLRPCRFITDGLILRLKYGCYLIVYPVPIAISKPLTRCYQLADPGDFGLSE